MTQTKHTPGPKWDAGFDLYNAGNRPKNSDIMRVVYDDKGRIVCQLSYHAVEDANDKDKAISEYAALIAAAPDLLEALKVARNAIKELPEWLELKEQVNTAINKAEGK